MMERARRLYLGVEEELSRRGYSEPSSPALARELHRAAKERGVGMLDAPVSGGDVGAEEGTLSILAGGDEEDFGRAVPLFEVMGETVVHVGGAGTGQTVKACNQIVVALVIEAVSEALVLATRCRADPEKVAQALSGGLATSKVLEVKGGKLLSHDFSPGGKAEYHRKDLGIARAAAREHGAALPVTVAVDQMFGALIAKGRAAGTTPPSSPSSRGGPGPAIHSGLTRTVLLSAGHVDPEEDHRPAQDHVGRQALPEEHDAR